MKLGDDSGVYMCVVELIFRKLVCAGAHASSVSYIIIIYSATRLPGCIRDNYNNVDCRGGAITAFPVTVLGFELQHTGGP